MKANTKPIRDKGFFMWFTEQEYDDLKKEAKENGYPMAYIIREGIRLYFRRGLNGRNTSV